MRDLLLAPKRGRGTVALIEGEAGIGKSTLLQATFERARDKGWTVLLATADELDLRRPFALAEAALGPVDAEVTSSWGGAVGSPGPSPKPWSPKR